MSIDVSNTGIGCYSGCLTSSQIIINGADTICPDGSQVERFLLYLICGFVVSILCTIYHQYIHKLVVQIKNIMDGKNKNYTVIIISFVKFWLVTIAVLYINEYWKYCSDDSSEVVESCTSPELSSCYSFCGRTLDTVITINDDIGLQHYSEGGYCTAIFEGSCACTYWQIFQLVPLLLHFLQFVMQCICIFGFSMFDPQQAHYNMIARYVLQQSKHRSDDLMYSSLLEGTCSDVDEDMKSEDRDDVSTAVDVIVKAVDVDEVYLSPECVDSDTPINSNINGDGETAVDCDCEKSKSVEVEVESEVASESDSDSQSCSDVVLKSTSSYRMSGTVIEFSSLLRQLLSQPWYGVFAFVEMGTFIYVWMELFYSPVHCGGGVHISQLYYPIIMTFLDMGKLNAYMSIQFLKQGLYVDAVVISFNIYVFALYGYLTMRLAFSYLRTVILFLYTTILDLFYESDESIHISRL